MSKTLRSTRFLKCSTLGGAPLRTALRKLHFGRCATSDSLRKAPLREVRQFGRLRESSTSGGAPLQTALRKLHFRRCAISNGFGEISTSVGAPLQMAHQFGWLKESSFGRCATSDDLRKAPLWEVRHFGRLWGCSTKEKYLHNDSCNIREKALRPVKTTPMASGVLPPLRRLAVDGLPAKHEIWTQQGQTLPSSILVLMERWMDSTHTFHLPFEEMTITPIDFAAIIELSFGGRSVVFDDRMRTLDHPGLRVSLRAAIGIEPTISDQRVRRIPVVEEIPTVPLLDIDSASLILPVFGFTAYEILSYDFGADVVALRLLVNRALGSYLQRSQMACPWWYIERVTVSSYILCVPLCGLSMAFAYYPSCVARQYSRHQAVPDYTQFKGGLFTHGFLSRFISTWPNCMTLPISDVADTSSSDLYRTWLQVFSGVSADSESTDLLTARILLGPSM
ncbi:hypothetical protein JCGZ_25284 [Jatropha curcas]|uniref:Aminotransferase-like plant mobile domain-containing protein n=1 Tax=Jatropha curcas TaxID=180498 RepID=A0A067JLQ7_JATCU|nr:hypothetical protein JCGZ_25284 [Jatropha curcas]